MQIAIESPRPGITVIRPAGTLDMNSVPAFRQQLETQTKHVQHGLILAMDAVQFMDSAGIAVLIEGLKWCRSRDVPYILTELTQAVQMVIELARLDNFFTIAASLDDAIAQLVTTS